MISKLNPKKLILILSVLIFLILIFSGSIYVWWNSAPAEKTCSSCHEIVPSVQSHRQSSHRNVSCSECHGTALSCGIHSLREKGSMVIYHISRGVDVVRLNEKQILEVMGNCIRCHTFEYAEWKQSGHSAKYSDLFLDTTHNKSEQLHPDCLRCHGMFYDGHIEDLVEPLNIEGPWRLRETGTAGMPTMPCMACHKIHSPGNISSSPDYSNPKEIYYSGQRSLSQVFFYDRHEKTHFRAEDLPKLKLWERNREVSVSNEPIMRTCIQCHAPDARHMAGTSDDRTPRGVHEGISCIACHEPHSNNAAGSCKYCHPAISNCRQDVTLMNVSYRDKNSTNNIHWVSCSNCHTDNKKKRI